ncbi:WD40-repeat-containing domain protein [Obelidium mucronatum]|nr:WD40-repeat-containing domain protein [Obelidium mucronatum]
MQSQPGMSLLTMEHLRPSLDDDSEDLCLSATDSAFSHDPEEDLDFTSAIPFEVLVQILCSVDSLSTLSNATRLNQRWKLAASDNSVWRHMFRRKFGCEKKVSQKLKDSGFFGGSRDVFDPEAFKPQLELARTSELQLASNLGSSSDLGSGGELLPSVKALKSRISRSDPQVYFWDPSLNENTMDVDPLSSSENNGEGQVAEQDYSKRIDPQQSPLPVNQRLQQLEGISSWKTVFHQRLILYRNWREGNYTVRSFTGHTDAVYCIQFQGDLLASGSRDRSLKFWDMNAIHCHRTLSGHAGSILCMQHDNENYIVTGSSDATAILWDYKTGGILRRFTGHALPVLDIRFDSTRIVTCSKDCTLKVWSLQTGELLHSMEGHQAAVNAVHMNGDLVVSASGDCTIKMWNLVTGALVRTFIGHTRGLACVQFDGKVILSGSNDFTIKIWDAMTGALQRTLEGHTNLVRTLCFDDERIVSGSYDNSMKVWDRKTGECLHTLTHVHNSWVFHVQMDASRIVSSAQDKRIAIWEFGKGCHLVKAFS